MTSAGFALAMIVGALVLMVATTAVMVFALTGGNTRFLPLHIVLLLLQAAVLAANVQIFLRAKG